MNHPDESRLEEESSPLWRGEGKSGDLLLGAKDRLSDSFVTRQGKKYLLAHLVLAVTWISVTSFAALYVMHGKENECIRPRLIYTPMHDAIQYERQTLWRSVENNSFTGEPRKELDEAYGQLLDSITIKVTGDELKKVGLGHYDSIALADGSGYIAEPAMLHEIHCIKRIRQHLHLDYYHKDMTNFDWDLENFHIDHCLEYLREQAMCRSDTAIATFKWRNGQPTSHTWSEHECVNWDKLISWTRSRSVDLSDLSILAPGVSKPL